MKWQITLSSSRNDVYELWHKEKRLLTLDFHSNTNSARIEYLDTRRVFLIRREGFLKNKTVLCNEYGVRLGYIAHDNKENAIELNNKKFFYTLKNNELIIYKESPQKPLVVCELNINIGNNGLAVIKEKKLTPESQVYSSLLLALGWYMFLPVARESAVEYVA